MTAADKLAEALREISEQQHKPNCRYKNTPVGECPNCPSAKMIATDALATYEREKAGQAEYICRKCGLRQSQSLPPPEF